jgi:hypothetical protein
VPADDNSTCCSPKPTSVLSPIQLCSYLSIYIAAVGRLREGVERRLY